MGEMKEDRSYTHPSAIPFIDGVDEEKREDLEVAVPSTKPQGLSRRSKIISTVFIYTAMTFLGMGANLIGPSLLDLEYLTNSTTKTISPLFNWRYGGYFLGTLIVGPLIDRIDEILVLGIAQGGLGISTAITPFCRTLLTLFATSVFVGLSQSCNTVTMSAALIKLWGDASDPFQQALHFFVALGGSISPQILKPFLMVIKEPKTIPTSNSSRLSIETFLLEPTNITDLDYNENMNASELAAQHTESKIHYGWLVVATGMLLMCVVGMAIVAIVLKCQIRKEVVKKAKKAASGKSLIDGKPKIFLLVLFTILAFMHGGLEETNWGMLMTFAVKHLKMSKRVGSDMVTMFWVVCTVARASSVVICKYVKPSIFLAIEISLILFSNVLLTIVIDHHWITPWICVALSGIGVSSIMPSIVNWAKGTITLQGKETAIIFAGFAAMKMLSPALLGYLFEVHTGMWFVYILILYSSIALLTFSGICVAIFFLNKRVENHGEYNVKEGEIKSAEL